MRIFGFQRSMLARSLCALATVLVAGTLHAQNITVTAANSSNDAIYNVTFSNGGGSITVLNTDAGSLHHLVSLAFYSNPSTFQLDLLAADNQGGKIVRYPGDFKPGTPTTGTVVFSAGGGPGPARPDGLSVDGGGNLFATSIRSSEEDETRAQLWVLPANGAGGFATPVLIDNRYSENQALQETLVADRTIIPPGAAQPVVNPGDLLVLSSNPNVVLLYANSGGNGPLGPTRPTTLLTLPAGSIPGGLAFWPPDNSLLITTSRGTIYQYHLTPNETPAIFASGLGNGQFKIKTGTQSGKPYAYVANNNGGDILQFAGPNQLVATVTAGVQHPQGLAVTNISYAAVTTCQNQQTNGCDLLGGKILTHDVPTNLSLSGNILENVCIVAVDPRLVQANSCTTPLQVSQVCGGYSSTVTIPASLCGSSGPSGKGFALIKTKTQAYALQNSFPFNGALIFNDSNLGNILPPAPNNPVCNPPGEGVTPLGTFAWAPLAGEGIVVEGTDMLEITSGCDGGTSKSYGLSLFGIGLGLNTNDLVGYTSTKYANALATITAEVNDPVGPNLTVLPAPITPANQPPDGNFTYQLQQCIATSKAAFATSPTDYSGAALEALAADGQIAAVASLAAPFTPDNDFPNPSGALRQRLQNIYYTINTRLQGNQAASTVPASPPPPPSPSISGTPITRVRPGTAYSFQPSAADFAGNTGTLTYSIAGQPSWASFNTNTGLLSGTAVAGTYPGIVITVTDGCASASLAAFTITVHEEEEE